LKNLLIISPSFPPINAADMHRVRQSVSYFQEFGWNPIVLTVKPELIEGNRDEKLLRTIPTETEVIYVDAFSTRWTRKIGLGSLGLRSLWFYRSSGNQILKNRKIDLIYFSTTMFPVMVLGNYWKKKFRVPYIIDMQDPWYSDHYRKLPKAQRPPKFWFSYRLNKFMEPIAMQQVSGIISVSQGYCDTLQERYSTIRPDNCTVIPFGAFSRDFDVLQEQHPANPFFQPNPNHISVVYVGRGGHDMAYSLSAILGALKWGLVEHPQLFTKIRMYFIGTSYAPDGQGTSTIAPLARKEGLDAYVVESTDRIPYFNALKVLKDADMLLVPGSTDPSYTASKLYPYIMARRPLLAVCNEQSSIGRILQDTGAGEVILFKNNSSSESVIKKIYVRWLAMLSSLPYCPAINWAAFEPYTAREMTRRQANFFDTILQAKHGEKEPSRVSV
jgi:hypothetical protein